MAFEAGAGCGCQILAQILGAAVATSLKGFAMSLRRDIAAIQAALDLPWTTSLVEAKSTG